MGLGSEKGTVKNEQMVTNTMISSLLWRDVPWRCASIYYIALAHRRQPAEEGRPPWGCVGSLGLGLQHRRTSG